MHATIKKMNKHVMRLQKEVDDARDKYDAYQRKVCLTYAIMIISYAVSWYWTYLVKYQCDKYLTVKLPVGAIIVDNGKRSTYSFQAAFWS